MAAHPPTPPRPPRPPIPGSSQHPTGTLGTNANADGLCDHEEAVLCLDEDGKREYGQGQVQGGHRRCWSSKAEKGGG